MPQVVSLLINILADLLSWHSHLHNIYTQVTHLLHILWVRWRLINHNITIIALHVCGTALDLVLNAIDIHLNALHQLLTLIQLCDGPQYIECGGQPDLFDPCARVLQLTQPPLPSSPSV